MTSASQWFASADTSARPEMSEYERIALGPKLALEMLQDAERTMTRRLNDLDERPLDTWPGYELRIYVQGGADLLDSDREVRRLMTRLASQGKRAGVRLEVQW